MFVAKERKEGDGTGTRMRRVKSDARAQDHEDSLVFNMRQALLGCVLLAAGLAVYVFGRKVVPILGAPVAYGDMARFSASLTWLLGFIPSFIHASAFCLLTASLFPPAFRTSRIICSGWAAVHVILECGQASWCSSLLAPLFAGVERSPHLLLRLEAYFRSGTFDPLDVLSALLGCLAAYTIINRPLVVRRPILVRGGRYDE